MVILFLLLIILIIRTNSQIKNNPIYLTNKRNLFVLNSTDDYYYVITSGESFQIEKESGNIINSSDNELNIANSFLVKDFSGNNYIFNKNSYFSLLNIYYYYINYNPFIYFRKDFLIQALSMHSKIRIINSISQNDSIIYGYYQKELFFFRKMREYSASIIFPDDLNDDLSCKFIEEDHFICVVFSRKTFYLNIQQN